MRNNAVARIIKDAQKNISKGNDNIDINRFIQNYKLIIKYCKNVLNLNPSYTPEELKDLILTRLSYYNLEYCKKANFRGKLFQLEAVEELLQNPELLKKEYELCKQSNYPDNDKPSIYDANLKKSCRQVIKDIVIAMEKDEEEIDEETKTFLEKYKNANNRERKVLEQKGYIKDIEGLKELLPMLIGKPIDKIKARLERIKGLLEEEIKNEQIETMELISTFFDEFDLLERYIRDQNNFVIKNLNINLSYSISTSQYTCDDIGIRELFSREFLEKQSFEDVLTYSSFWQNKFAKTCLKLNQGLFTIDTLNLWGNIIEGKQVEINPNQARAIMKKEGCLNLLIENILCGVKGNLNPQNLSEEDLDKGYTAVDINGIVEAYNKQEGQNYKNIFDEIIPESENNLIRDIATKKILFNQINNIYRLKDSIIAFKVRSLFRTKKSRNWGVIKKEFRNGQLTDVLSDKSNKIIVAVDYEGINMPLRLHIDRNLLSNLIRLYNGTTIIPLYEGSEDFIVNGNLFTTNALMPIPKRHRKLINDEIKNAEEGSDRRNVLEHLLFLSNKDKYPLHLKRKIHTRKGTVYERPSRKYLDLNTGTEYYKTKNEFIPVEESEHSEASR